MPNRPTSVSSLSASATATPTWLARQRVAGEARLVVVFDGEGDVLGLAVVARVVAAHDALQLGELADHVGQQVGLGQQRGAVGLRGQRRRRRAARRWRGRSRARARRARPACRACRDRPPWPAPARAIRASSCGPGRRRTWHRPGAGAPRARCLRSLRLASAGRMLLTTRNWLRQPAVGVEQREVLLVGLHRQDQALAAARPGTAARTGRPARWGARPAR